MVNRVLILVSIAFTAVLLAMMNFMTPTEAGPLGVLVFFTTLYIVFFGFTAAIVAIFFKIRGKTKLGQKGYAYAGFLALAPIILLVMRPFIGFSFLALGVTGIFEFLGCFLIAKIA
ncbi:MAG: hypothetical protein Q4E46_02930 [Candidatus Saccharibacteria bacterium]|nr:hypothetical protein [Candidatus Saccharibacteria bacterium]